MNVIDKPAPAMAAPAMGAPAPLATHPTLPPPARLKPGIWVGLLALGGIAAGAGFFLLNRPDPAPRPGPAAVTGTPAAPGEFRLNDGELRALRIERVAARGFRTERVAEGRISVNEDRSTPVLPPFPGRITRVHAQLGDRVRAGAPLFDMDSPDMTQAAQDLLAALDNAGKAGTTLDQARRENARQASLFSARAASQRDVEQARAALTTAEADERIAEATLASARDRLRVLGRDAAQVAELERTRAVHAGITVTAPFDGAVTQRRASPGTWLAAGGGEAVMTISDLSTMWLVAAVREADVPLIRTGMPLLVNLGALPGRDFTARIVRSGTGLDPATRRMTVFAEVQDPEGVLRPEMFATFRIAVSEERLAPGVPASAVIFRGSQASLWTAMDGNRFALRQVALGARDGDAYEVRSGLDAGERIVTGGALFIDRAARVD